MSKIDYIALGASYADNACHCDRNPCRCKFARLSSFVVTYDNGERRPTDMAAGITLEEARRHFVGTRFVQRDEKTYITGVAVEEFTEPAGA